jgi:hypothetical protein
MLTAMGYRLAVLSILAASVYAGQKLEVKIVNRQTGESGYSFVVQGTSQTTTNANASCNGNPYSAICSGTANSTTRTTPAQQRSYSVTGATLSLQLPDGRIAVVNCASKPNMGFGTPRRSCRIPLVDNIQAEFDGDSAKLIWPVSIDGKKMGSETYKILAVLAKP